MGSYNWTIEVGGSFNEGTYYIEGDDSTINFTDNGGGYFITTTNPKTKVCGYILMTNNNKQNGVRLLIGTPAKLWHDGNLWYNWTQPNHEIFAFDLNVGQGYVISSTSSIPIPIFNNKEDASHYSAGEPYDASNIMFGSDQPPYNWISVPSVSGKNGILSLSTSTDTNNGEAITTSDTTKFALTAESNINKLIVDRMNQGD